MRAYIAVSGVLFMVVAGAHASELLGGGLWHLREPDFVISSLGVIGMVAWAATLLIRKAK